MIGELNSDDFTAFFRDVHGQAPFPWQRRLTAQVLDRGAWPKVIDLPTGAGKTAVLDTAVFVMAARAATFPRRIVFVIDRRIVVDQVCQRAERIRDRVAAGKTPILQRVRKRLRALSDTESPLGVAALRGGIPVEHEWTHRPDQPWVMVSTVDQFGSRLLFRGYGVTPGMRPVHAGLAGNDCLVILDEVHLSVPFAETLANISGLSTGGLPRRFAIVEMSATPSDRNAEPFKLDPATDLNGCEELRQRIEAPKQAELVSVRNHDALPATVVKIVKSIARSEKTDLRIRSAGVVVNRVRSAREIHRALAGAGYATHLITGRMRPLDRVDALNRIGPIVDPDGERPLDELTVVVATQAIEVGADFSFDALITECAAVDSLRQRFGRLDRRGTYFARTGRAAHCWIIGPKSVVDSRKPDPIYGDSARKTWEELKRREQCGPIDVGPTSLRDFPIDATAPRARAPLLLRTHMDAWTQTSPEPIVQPSVAWFLHGIDQNRPADVSILWRWDRSPEALRLVPPRQAEYLQVPIDATRAWLSASDEVDVTDVDMAGAEADTTSSSESATAGCVRWTGFGKDPEHVGIDDIRPGDVLIVDPTRGGLTGGTWDPLSTTPATDLGDAAQLAYRRRATLRLDPRLLETTLPAAPSDDADVDLSARQRIEEWLEDPRGADRPAWCAAAAERLMRNGFDLVPVGLDDADSRAAYYVLTERHSRTQKPVVDPATLDGSDEVGSRTGAGVTLRHHLDGVGERAGCIAERLGLTKPFVGDLRVAGRLHDIGKVDRRFQDQLVGGDPVELELRRDTPLAKSLPGARPVRRYPTGMRHEMVSMAMIASNADVLRTAHDKDLVLHLVGSHHGWGRPLPPVIEDPKPQTLSYEFDGHSLQVNSALAESSLAIDMADRFWRLVARYGYHGLAWLEAILRLADHQQSAEEAAQS